MFRLSCLASFLGLLASANLVSAQHHGGGHAGGHAAPHMSGPAYHGGLNNHGYHGGSYSSGYRGGFGYPYSYGYPYGGFGFGFSTGGIGYPYGYSFNNFPLSYGMGSAYGAYRVVPVVPLQPAAPAVIPYVPAANSSTPAAAVVNLTVPDGATVWFNDNETPAPGGKATFTSPVIAAGSTNTLSLKARWNGSTREMSLTLRPGDKMGIDLRNQ